MNHKQQLKKLHFQVFSNKSMGDFVGEITAIEKRCSY